MDSYDFLIFLFCCRAEASFLSFPLISSPFLYWGVYATHKINGFCSLQYSSLGMIALYFSKAKVR